MKVLIAHASAGGGHRRAAEALFQFLKDNRKDFELEIADTLEFSGHFFRFCYTKGYPFLVHYGTGIWGALFFLTQTGPIRFIGRKIAQAINYFSCAAFREFLSKKKFDYIISTHFLSSELACGLKLNNKIRSKIITVITDFGVHPFWISEGTDVYMVASEFTKTKLCSMGVEAGRIKVSGIPVSPNFNRSFDRNMLAPKLGLDPEKFTVLVMTGSFGSGPLEKIAREISKDAQVAVVCANNKKLFLTLSKKKLKGIKVFGFINNPEELMAVSDIIITKPGGLSIAELLSMGLFPVFISEIPGQESENIKVLSYYGIGAKPTRIKQIKELVLQLKNNPEELKKFKDMIRQLAKPGCQEIAGVIR